MYNKTFANENVILKLSQESSVYECFNIFRTFNIKFWENKF